MKNHFLRYYIPAFLALLFFCFRSPRLAYAILEFRSRHEVTYTIGSQGEAKVNQTIKLINNFSNIYPKEYYLETESEIKSPLAWDDGGNILNSVDKHDKSNVIKLKFNKEVVGKDKELVFYVEYTIPNFAKKKGLVWELSLPNIGNIADSESYRTDLLVPSSFGNLSYASLKPKAENLGKQIKLSYEKNDLISGNIILAFGDFQTYQFSLAYFLENNEPGPRKFQIAIPPETDYQEVFYSKIDPEPVDVDLDENGNWLAVYYLEENASTKVTVDGIAKIFSKPKPSVANTDQANLNNFLGESRYWPVNNPTILSLASRYKTPRAIYNYVVSSLSYNYDFSGAIERKGAIGALANPENSVCTEFTDLFVTLARAAGIPAREVEGFAYTNNPKLKPLSLKTDVLHAWPEYWDKGRSVWVQIDPTWEKTTGGVDYFQNFDFNHFAFVIHGQSSENPPPPGSYTDDIATGKTVMVEFASDIKGDSVVSLNDFNATLSFPGQGSFDLSSLTNFNQSLILQNNSLYTLKNVKLVPKGYQIGLMGKPIKTIEFSTATKQEGQKEYKLLLPLSKEKINTPQVSLFIRLFFNPRYYYEVLAGDNSANSQTFAVENHSQEKLFVFVRIIFIVLLTILFLGIRLLIVRRKVAKL